MQLHRIYIIILKGAKESTVKKVKQRKAERQPANFNPLSPCLMSKHFLDLQLLLTVLTAALFFLSWFHTPSAASLNGYPTALASPPSWISNKIQGFPSLPHTVSYQGYRQVSDSCLAIFRLTIQGDFTTPFLYL